MNTHRIVITSLLALFLVAPEFLLASASASICPANNNQASTWKEAVNHTSGNRKERKLFRGKEADGSIILGTFIQTPSNDPAWVTGCPMILQEIKPPVGEDGCRLAPVSLRAGDLISVRKESDKRYFAKVNDSLEIPMVAESNEPGDVQWLTGYHSGFLYFVFLIERSQHQPSRKGYRIEMFDLTQTECLKYIPEAVLCEEGQTPQQCAIDKASLIADEIMQTGTGEGEEPDPRH